MYRFLRDQFLTFPAGTVYLQQNVHYTCFAIKGPTAVNGSFIKRIALPQGDGKMRLRNRNQDNATQVEFLILDQLEVEVCQQELFNKLETWDMATYQNHTLRILATFNEMPNIAIQLPDGTHIIANDRPEVLVASVPHSLN